MRATTGASSFEIAQSEIGAFADSGIVPPPSCLISAPSL